MPPRGLVGYTPRAAAPSPISVSRSPTTIIDQLRPCRATPDTNFSREWWLSRGAESSPVAPLLRYAKKKVGPAHADVIRLWVQRDEVTPEPGDARKNSLERYLEHHRPHTSLADSVSSRRWLLDYYRTLGRCAQRRQRQDECCGYWVRSSAMRTVAEATRRHARIFVRSFGGSKDSPRLIFELTSASVRPPLQRAWRREDARARPNPSVKAITLTAGLPLKIAEPLASSGSPDHLS